MIYIFLAIVLLVYKKIVDYLYRNLQLLWLFCYFNNLFKSPIIIENLFKVYINLLSILISYIYILFYIYISKIYNTNVKTQYKYILKYINCNLYLLFDNFD